MLCNRSIVTLGLAALVASALLGSGASAQTLSVQVRPTRTRGVAPLAVLFDATGSRPARAGDDAFHDLRYAWDFGDPGAGTWGPSRKPRNKELGPLAGHVFEKPGTYDVVVRVRDEAGNSGQASVRITVDSPASLQTLCFANDNGDWSDPGGACSGAQRIVTSDFAAAMSRVGPGRRLLFRRGDTFTMNGTVTTGGQGPVVIGAFGSGAAPIVRQNAFQSTFAFFSLDDWRIMDLDLRGTGRANTSASTYHFSESGPNAQYRRLTLLRITASGQHNAIGFTTQWGIVTPLHEELAVVDCTFHQFADSGGRGSGVRFDVNRSMFLGNQLIDNENNEFNMRTQHLEKSVIAHNLMDRPKDQKGNLTIRACNWFKSCGGTGDKQAGGTPGVGDTREFIIADNHFRMRTRGAQVSINPQNPDSFEVIRQGLVERNFFEGVPGGGVQRGLKLHASDITIRNNVFDSTHWWSDPNRTGVTREAISVTRNSRVGVPDSTNVRIAHNTHYDGSSWPGGVEMVDSTSGSGHEVVNNLLYAPNTSGTLMPRAVGVARNQGNLQNGRGYQGNPFATQNPSLPADFRLRSDSPARDAGASAPGALVDFAGANRPAGGAYDVGAFEVVTQGGPSAPAAPVLLP